MKDAERFRTLLLSSLRIMAGILIGLLALLALLYFLQDKLIFFPQKLPKEEADRLSKRYSHIENINLKTGNNISIKGWLVKNSNLTKSPLIIYFGGNAEELSYLIYYADKVKGWSLALINYRGYGLSEGKPSEKDLYADAVYIYDYFSKRDDIDNARIVLIGRSLGTGVATYLAQMRPVKALMLVSPYDSIISIGKHHYPFLPVNLLLRHRFDSLSRAPLISAPLLVITAADDTIIPLKFSKRLAEKWGGPHSFKIIEGEDHNTIHDNAEYWKTMNEFLQKF
ncbi:MAG: alpha/beta hydrolase [Nitrospira sp.]|nr:alpha/beta hydrolase [Nitrospira sp.]